MASPKMRVAVGQYPVVTKEYLDYALALGCEGVSFNVPEIPGAAKWDEKDIREFIKPVLAAGLTVESFENVPNHFYDKAMLGLPGRDEALGKPSGGTKSLPGA